VDVECIKIGTISSLKTGNTRRRGNHIMACFEKKQAWKWMHGVFRIIKAF